jgi:hypothetical protein
MSKSEQNSKDFQLISYYCYKCKKEITFLRNNKKCSECGSGFVEEMTELSLKLNEEKNECSICLEEITSKALDKKQLNCGHNFHKECVNEWLETNNTCPLCRTQVITNYGLRITTKPFMRHPIPIPQQLIYSSHFMTTVFRNINSQTNYD